ncbi:MAG TPA: carboxypeptidase M32 [Rhodothermia bacterium]
MGQALPKLKERLAEVEDLRGAASLLAWDQETYMPRGAVETRAAQSATLERLIHERATAGEVGDLIATASEEVASLDPDSTDARLVKVARRDFDRATKIPSRLVAEFAETTARAMPAWADARKRNDFAAFAPHLEKVVGLCVEKAEAVGYEDDPYDALLDEFEPEMKTAEVDRVFSQLRSNLVPIVKAIGSDEPPETGFLHQRYDEQVQWDFGIRVVKDLGYDFERGRQDRSAHPFTIHFSADDVRITTRVNEDFLPTALFGTLHEAGHALYEQGIAPELKRTPLAKGTSLGIHESQSRLWENQVGRSRVFWRAYYPDLQLAFPAQLGAVPVDEFYRAINRVEPSLIRVEADEVTYNLHIMLRFELERALIAGELKVADLPGIWNDRMADYLGVVPDDDASGVLQDVHWSMAAFGYFPTYTLGTLMSAQVFAALRSDLEDIDDLIATRDFAPLLEWLQNRIYRHGRTFTAAETLKACTGQTLDSAGWLAYIKGKFGRIYGSLA